MRKIRLKKHKSFVAWQGTSSLDGKPIAVIVVRGSANKKTGALVQTYILRTDVSPLEALKTGDDFSICGLCIHGPKNENRPNGNGSCYVQVQNAPTGIYKAFVRGSYPVLTLEESAQQLDGELVRLGAYGDPCTVPFEVWETLLRGAKDWTGYTHQWKNESNKNFQRFCMASCDTIAEDTIARANGWRAFTVTPKNSDVIPHKSFLCPASEEAGKKLNCIDCMACNGTASNRTASVYIPVHGVAFKQNRFNNLIQIGRA